MKLPKIKKEYICTALTVVYHMTFLGGATTLGNHYISEYQKTRDVIVAQVDRAEKIVKTAQKSVDKVTKSADKNTKKITKALDSVKKACKF